MKVKVALFGWTRYPEWSPHARIMSNPDEYVEPTYVQLTEAVEIDFPDLDERTKIAKRIASLKADRKFCNDARREKVSPFDERVVAIDAELQQLEEQYRSLNTSAPPAAEERAGAI